MNEHALESASSQRLRRGLRIVGLERAVKRAAGRVSRCVSKEWHWLVLRKIAPEEREWQVVL